MSVRAPSEPPQRQLAWQVESPHCRNAFWAAFPPRPQLCAQVAPDEPFARHAARQFHHALHVASAQQAFCCVQQLLARQAPHTPAAATQVADPHAPPLQVPLQQSEPAPHATPSLAHCPHTPCVQALAQHWLAAVHPSPSVRHAEAPHLPLTHAPEQHW